MYCFKAVKAFLSLLYLSCCITGNEYLIQSRKQKFPHGLFVKITSLWCYFPFIVLDFKYKYFIDTYTKSINRGFPLFAIGRFTCIYVIRGFWQYM